VLESFLLSSWISVLFLSFFFVVFVCVHKRIMALDSEQKAAQQKQGPGTFADFKFNSKLVCCSALRSVLLVCKVPNYFCSCERVK